MAEALEPRASMSLVGRTPARAAAREVSKRRSCRNFFVGRSAAALAVFLDASLRALLVRRQIDLGSLRSGLFTVVYDSSIAEKPRGVSDS
jgi:hypothetical protein